MHTRTHMHKHTHTHTCTCTHTYTQHTHTHAHTHTRTSTNTQCMFYTCPSLFFPRSLPPLPLPLPPYSLWVASDHSRSYSLLGTCCSQHLHSDPSPHLPIPHLTSLPLTSPPYPLPHLPTPHLTSLPLTSPPYSSLHLPLYMSRSVNTATMLSTLL